VSCCIDVDVCSRVDDIQNDNDVLTVDINASRHDNYSIDVAASHKHTYASADVAWPDAALVNVICHASDDESVDGNAAACVNALCCVVPW
jgi:hypothetical protein